MAIPWALKRQVFYVSVLALFFGVFGFLIVSPLVSKMPTCQDGKRNGDEAGIDCGGSCDRVCLYQVDEVSILWARAFQVVPGRYNAVAYLENHNPLSTIRSIRYRFRFADKDNIYIGMREGEALVPPSTKFAVFESALDFGNALPVYTTFEFTETPQWLKAPEDKMREINILVGEVEFIDKSVNPRLSAVIKNDSLFIIPNIDVIAILYDEDKNAISASRTYIDELDRGGQTEVNFTWAQQFSKTVISKEIIPIYDIFLTKLK